MPQQWLAESGLREERSMLTCWMRSTVVARSMATRGKVLGAVIFFLMRSPCCMSWLSLLETSCTALASKAHQRSCCLSCTARAA